MISLADFALWGPWLAGATFLLLIGKALRCESRALMFGVVVALGAGGEPSALYAAGAVVLTFRLLDLIHF